MKMSTAGLMALIAREAIVLTRYKDSVGVWTIGVGHTKAAGGIDPATFTGTLTIQQVLDMLRTDIASYEDDVNHAVRALLKQHEFDALVSFHYNTGGIKVASLTKSINAGDKQTAAIQFMNWVTPTSIKARRDSERLQFVSGIYPEPFATIYPADASGNIQWSKGKRTDLRGVLTTTEPTPLDQPIVDPAIERVKWIQTRLMAHNRNPGPIDGDMGPRTKDALAGFIIAKHITPDVIDANTASALAADPT
jgi:lysozyme